jgi:thiol-disulfide isomerase/thioredoxin
MSGLLFLKAGDFYIGKGVQGKILCHSIPSFSLILFYSTKCNHCHELLPIFKNLPGKVNNCQFGMVNVSSREGKPVISMAQETIAPIEFVPYIILYEGGKPRVRYNGPRNENVIRQFVMDSAKRIHEKQPFTEKDKYTMTKNSKIPAYSWGMPLCGEDQVCYLTDQELQSKAQQAGVGQQQGMRRAQ